MYYTYRGWFDWLVPLQAYIQTIIVLFAFTMFSFGMLHRATSGSGSLILLVVFQQASFHALRTPLLCSILSPGTLSQASSGSGSLCPYSWRWQIIDCDYSMNNHKSPTNATLTANWIAHGGVYAYGRFGDGLNKFHGQYRYSPGVHHIL